VESILDVFCHNCLEVMCNVCFSEDHVGHRASSLMDTVGKLRAKVQTSHKKLGGYLKTIRSKLDELDLDEHNMLQQVREDNALIYTKVIIIIFCCYFLL